jgi:aspartyl-tRNA(Asn)/glutamyl-tRNA(Gln) amidotransferase subunit C
MTKLSEKDVEHVAQLAKLQLKSGELHKFQQQLSKIVEHISELQEVDTQDVEPTSQTTGLENVFRVDEVSLEKALTTENALSGKDNTVNGYFQVEAILKERPDK